MHLFWSNYIEPILKLVKPNTIVEIGSEHGDNSVKIINYCQKNNARCHLIDPIPGKKIEANREALSKVGEFHQGLSLEVLPKLEHADVYLIDGDHNWYTVQSELKLIYYQAKDNDYKLPLCLFHDVSWPYARRDMYYDPENIPTEHRQKYEKKGIVMGQSRLDESGINGNFNNAVIEGGPKNGVLTGVEDFIKKVGGDYSLEVVGGLFGLGLLIPGDLDNSVKERIQGLLADVNVTRKHSESIEAERLRTYRELSNDNNNLLTQMGLLHRGTRELEKKRIEQIAVIKEKSLQLQKKSDEYERVKAELNKIVRSRTYRMMDRYWRLKKKITSNK